MPDFGVPDNDALEQADDVQDERSSDADVSRALDAPENDALEQAATVSDPAVTAPRVSTGMEVPEHDAQEQGQDAGFSEDDYR